MTKTQPYSLFMSEESTHNNMTGLRHYSQEITNLPCLMNYPLMTGGKFYSLSQTLKKNYTNNNSHTIDQQKEAYTKSLKNSYSYQCRVAANLYDIMKYWIFIGDELPSKLEKNQNVAKFAGHDQWETYNTTWNFPSWEVEVFFEKPVRKIGRILYYQEYNNILGTYDNIIPLKQLSTRIQQAYTKNRFQLNTPCINTTNINQGKDLLGFTESIYSRTTNPLSQEEHKSLLNYNTKRIFSRGIDPFMVICAIVTPYSSSKLTPLLNAIHNLVPLNILLTQGTTLPIVQNENIKLKRFTLNFISMRELIKEFYEFEFALYNYEDKTEVFELKSYNFWEQFHRLIVFKDFINMNNNKVCDNKYMSTIIKSNTPHINQPLNSLNTLYVYAKKLRQYYLNISQKEYLPIEFNSNDYSINTNCLTHEQYNNHTLLLDPDGQDLQEEYWCIKGEETKNNEITNDSNGSNQELYLLELFDVLFHVNKETSLLTNHEFINEFINNIHELTVIEYNIIFSLLIHEMIMYMSINPSYISSKLHDVLMKKHHFNFSTNKKNNPYYLSLLIFNVRNEQPYHLSEWSLLLTKTKEIIRTLTEIGFYDDEMTKLLPIHLFKPSFNDPNQKEVTYKVPQVEELKKYLGVSYRLTLEDHLVEKNMKRHIIDARIFTASYSKMTHTYHDYIPNVKNIINVNTYILLLNYGFEKLFEVMDAFIKINYNYYLAQLAEERYGTIVRSVGLSCRELFKTLHKVFRLSEDMPVSWALLTDEIEKSFVSNIISIIGADVYPINKNDETITIHNTGNAKNLLDDEILESFKEDGGEQKDSEIIGTTRYDIKYATHTEQCPINNDQCPSHKFSKKSSSTVLELGTEISIEFFTPPTENIGKAIINEDNSLTSMNKPINNASMNIIAKDPKITESNEENETERTELCIIRMYYTNGSTQDYLMQYKRMHERYYDVMLINGVLDEIN